MTHRVLVAVVECNSNNSVVTCWWTLKGAGRDEAFVVWYGDGGWLMFVVVIK